MCGLGPQLRIDHVVVDHILLQIYGRQRLRILVLLARAKVSWRIFQLLHLFCTRHARLAVGGHVRDKQQIVHQRRAVLDRGIQRIGLLRREESLLHYLLGMRLLDLIVRHPVVEGPISQHIILVLVR